MPSSPTSEDLPALTTTAVNSLRHSKVLYCPDSPHLCPVCAGVTLEKLSSERGYRHLSNGKELVKSAKDCALCCVLLKAICRNRLHREDVKGPIFVEADDLLTTFSRVLDYAPEDFSITIRLNCGLLDVWCLPDDETDEDSDHGEANVGLQNCVAQLRIFTDVPAHAEKWALPLGAALSPNTDLTLLKILFNHWLRICEEHPNCNGRSLSEDLVDRTLPTRVLDLRARDDKALQLLETKGRCGRYVALSHSWGGKQLLTTTRSTLSKRLDAISVVALPKTFRDAVAVTRVLGIDFLWIDSLCIIQDDPDDWNREATRMQNVYANAYLTIAATRARHSEDGFLGVRQDAEAIRFGTSDSESPSFYIGPRRRFDDDVDQGPLAKRAWVLQERVLSPRNLHFTSRQIYWECWAFHQGEDLECTGLGVMKDEMFPLALRPRAVIEPESLGRVPRSWWYLLSEYTAASLTYPSDKLIAIDALIKRMEHRLAIRNLKGVWAESWEISVLWAARDTGLEWNLETDAPSWSWASRTGPINHFQVSQFHQHDQICLERGRELHLRARLYSLNIHNKIGELLRSFPGAGPPELDYQSSRYRVITAKDGTEVGWLAMDQNDNDAVSHIHCSWVLVATAADSDDESDEESHTSLFCPEAEKWRPHYCILVLEVPEERSSRVGAGTVYYSSCLDSTDRFVEIK